MGNTTKAELTLSNPWFGRIGMGIKARHNQLSTDVAARTLANKGNWDQSIRTW